MKLSTLLGGAAVAASAALAFAAPASATAVYQFLDGSNVFFDIESDAVTAQMTITPYFCSVTSVCGTVTFTPTTSYDEITTKNGENFFYAPTAFTTTTALSSPLASPPAPASYDTTAQFGALVTSAAPEPSIWALMIAGVGMVGVALRRRTVGALSAFAA